MRRLFALIAALAILFSMTAPAMAGRRWTAPVPAPASDNGYGTCVDTVSYNQSHTNSSPSISRSGAAATLERDTTGLHLGFEDCALPGDSTGGSFLYVGLYARSGWEGSACTGDTTSCVITFGVTECHQPPETYQNACTSTISGGDPQQGKLFIYIKGCGATSSLQGFGITNDQTMSVSFSLQTDGWYHFYANGVEKASVSANASALSCWASNANGHINGALYGGTRWDSHDTMGQVNGYGSRVTHAQYGVYGQGFSGVNWTSGACVIENAPDGDCIRIAPDILRLESW